MTDANVVLEALDEEEAYLWAILQDESGLDICEFIMQDTTQEDNLFRAWAFQWKWWRCADEMQISASSRACGKSMGARARAIAFPFQHPDQQMVITAPIQNHLDLLTSAIEKNYTSSRLVTEMILKRQGSGIAIKHNPFLVEFKNGAKIDGRIPLSTGKNMKGLHPAILLMDEGQDYPEEGWNELFETINRSVTSRKWLIYGVTKGIRDKFHEFSQPSSRFTLHKYPAMYRPTWNDEEREDKIELYGSKTDPDYKRNVLGEPGDAVNSIFILSKLMKCIDEIKESIYNQDEYYWQKITHEVISDNNGDIYNVLDVPYTHKKYQAMNVWMGMDVGYINDPSEILTFVEQPGKKPSDPPLFKLVSRIHLDKVDAYEQAKAVLWLIDYYQPTVFAMDKTGNGYPLFTEIQRYTREDPETAPFIDRIVGYNFSEKILVDVDESKRKYLRQDHPDVLEEGIKRNVLEASTDVLRTLVDNRQLLLPFDMDIIKEFQGQTWHSTQGATDMYGRKRVFSRGSYHTLDAARMAALGWSQHAFQAFIKPVDAPYLAPLFIYGS